MNSHVTISEARTLAKRHGIDRMIILQVCDDGNFAFTSYGKDRQICKALSRLVDNSSQLESIAVSMFEAT